MGGGDWVPGGWGGVEPIFQTPAPPWAPKSAPLIVSRGGGGSERASGWGGGGGGGLVGTPTHIRQNEPHDALIILNMHNWA